MMNIRYLMKINYDMIPIGSHLIKVQQQMELTQLFNTLNRIESTHILTLAL